MSITSDATNQKKRGFAIILCSPSGAGKTTIEKTIIASDPNFISSISFTTRPIRNNEVDGIDYHFISETEFFKLKQNNLLLETEEVFDHYYATSRIQTEEALSNGKNIIYVVNWQGGLRLKDLLQKDSISFFIMPPSLKELKRRLISRRTDTQDEIKKRLSIALFEIRKQHLFDYVVINDDLTQSVKTIKQLITLHNKK